MTALTAQVLVGRWQIVLACALFMVSGFLIGAAMAKGYRDRTVTRLRKLNREQYAQVRKLTDERDALKKQGHVTTGTLLSLSTRIREMEQEDEQG